MAASPYLGASWRRRRRGHGWVILASDWSILITWPEYWPLIGRNGSRDWSSSLWLVHFQEACSTPPPWLTWNWRSLDTASVLWLVITDQVTWILASYWFRLITLLEYSPLIGWFSGKEEILALFDKTREPPEELVNFGTLFVEKCQFPLSMMQVSFLWKK